MAQALRVIEDSLIVRLAGDKRFIDEFPFLKKALAANQKCGTCPGKNRRLAQQRRDEINGIKNQIAGLATDRKARFKELLKAGKVRIRYRAPNQKLMSLTF